MLDGSTLHVREFVDVETEIERYMYAYYYQRDDNTEHHRKLKLPTFPHHKHAGDETNVIAAPVSTLAEVLAEIETLLDISQLTK